MALYTTKSKESLTVKHHQHDVVYGVAKCVDSDIC